MSDFFVSIRKTMLSGAYFILKYILGKVSTNRQRDLNEKAGSNSAIM